MSTLSAHYDNAGSTQREVFVTGSTVKKTYQTYISTFRCLIQPSGPTISQDIPGSFGKGWVMMCDVIDIKEGDKVIINSVTYKVDGIEKMDFLGRNKHMEVLLKTFNQ